MTNERWNFKNVKYKLFEETYARRVTERSDASVT